MKEGPGLNFQRLINGWGRETKQNKTNPYAFETAAGELRRICLAAMWSPSCVHQNRVDLEKNADSHALPRVFRGSEPGPGICMRKLYPQWFDGNEPQSPF